MYLWIKLSPEAQYAAKWCARHGYDGNIGDRLPDISSRAYDEIMSNLTTFRLAVHTYKSYPNGYAVRTDENGIPMRCF